jgi:hypothetical protein
MGCESKYRTAFSVSPGVRITMILPGNWAIGNDGIIALSYLLYIVLSILYLFRGAKIQKKCDFMMITDFFPLILQKN